MFLCLIYHLFLFSQWTTYEQQQPFGYTYLGCMLLLTFVNIIVVVLNTIDKLRAKRRIATIKKIRAQRAEIMSLIFNLRTNSIGKIGIETIESDESQDRKILLDNSLERMDQMVEDAREGSKKSKI